MRICYERYIICDFCGISHRQTATELPLDRIGHILNRIYKEEIKEEHKACNSGIISLSYTGWRVAKFNFRN